MTPKISQGARRRYYIYCLALRKECEECPGTWFPLKARKVSGTAKKRGMPTLRNKESRSSATNHALYSNSQEGFVCMFQIVEVASCSNGELKSFRSETRRPLSVPLILGVHIWKALN